MAQREVPAHSKGTFSSSVTEEEGREEEVTPGRETGYPLHISVHFHTGPCVSPLCQQGLK